MNRKIMVEVTKDELDLLDKEVTLENMLDKFVDKLREEKPTKVGTNTDPFSGEGVAVKLYELENYTIRLIASSWKEPQIEIIFKPKKKEVK